MKYLTTFMFVMLLSLSFCACDKPFSEEDDDTETTKDNSNEDDNDAVYGNGEDEGDDDSGVQTGDTLSVSAFISTSLYNTQVWVKGYIVGCATGAGGEKKYETNAPFSYDTALLIADDPNETDIDKMASICLYKKKALQEKANLKDNPQNKGKRIAVFGFQETYLKLLGIETIDAYEFPSK